MRLDKYIANNTGLSRKEAKRAAKNGEVLLNGSPIKDLSQELPANTEVSVFGQLVSAIAPLFLMINKPADVVCAMIDDAHVTVIDILSEAAFNNGDEPLIQALDANTNLQIVGRLDIDTTGLVLLTSDGQWNHKVTSPTHRCGKTYLVSLAEPITETAIAELEHGVLLEDSPKPTKPADVEQLSETTLKLTLYEGRYHQVKRMLAAVGNAVVQLHREQIGEIKLTEDIGPGQYRWLTNAEVESF